MDFDIRSMKQRANELIRGIKPSPMIVGTLFAVFYIVYEILFFGLSYSTYAIAIWVALEIVYVGFRISCEIYGLKVTREDKTSVSDVFAAFKRRAVASVLLGIIKDVCIFIGLCLCFIGAVFPIYWFRFAAHIIQDENVNVFKALGRSMKLLKGHYVELIKLDISNIGWIVLQIISCGIAAFYVKPYLSIVYAEFYDYLKAQGSLFD